MLSEDLASLWQRVEEKVGQEAEIFAEERREAPARAAELLALPPRVRTGRWTGSLGTTP